jgi:integrase
MFRIVPVRNSDRYSFVVDYKENGKRRRTFFATEKEARTHARDLERSLRANGESALARPAIDPSLVAQAATLLRPYGKTIVDAARVYAEILEAEKQAEHTQARVAVLTSQFIESKRLARFSSVYLTDIEHRLGRFNQVFGSRLINSIRPAEIESWLHGLSLSAASINNFRTIVCAFFSFALKRGLVTSNPVEVIDKLRVPSQAPAIFTPDLFRTVLAKAPASLIPSFVLGGFGGLRTSELLRLDWAEVDLARGFIHVAAAKTKSARRRLVKILSNLHAWLVPYARGTGPVFAGTERQYWHQLADLEATEPKTSWPPNGLRHSYASYHLARFENAAELALQLGHTTHRLIFEHYRELVTPEAAAQWWAIYPPVEATNVVEFKEVV